jgi:hypothetical protein
VLTAIPVVLVLILPAHWSVSLGMTVVVGLGVFGFVFAVISSLHSYLILAYMRARRRPPRMSASTTPPMRRGG